MSPSQRRKSTSQSAVAAIKAKIEEAIGYGVFKMNIDTDTQFAFANAVGGYVDENPKAFKFQIDPDDDTPYKTKYDPRKWLRAGELGVAERLDEAPPETLAADGEVLDRPLCLRTV